MATINVMLNYLGTPVSVGYFDRLSDGADHSSDFEYKMIGHVLELPVEHLPREVLERYIEVSGKESYPAILPYTDKVFERFLAPLKSAKRTYCLGEYLASVELCAHLGEMLAILVWQITPITLKGKKLDQATEKAMWGREYEKLGQEKRIDLLKVFGAISDENAQLLDYLRATRRNYFHFWSTTREHLKDDALECFLKIAKLIQSIMHIEYENGSVKLNPLIGTYLAERKMNDKGVNSTLDLLSE